MNHFVVFCKPNISTIHEILLTIETMACETSLACWLCNNITLQSLKFLLRRLAVGLVQQIGTATKIGNTEKMKAKLPAFKNNDEKQMTKNKQSKGKLNSFKLDSLPVKNSAKIFPVLFVVLLNRISMLSCIKLMGV